MKFVDQHKPVGGCVAGQHRAIVQSLQQIVGRFRYQSKAIHAIAALRFMRRIQQRVIRLCRFRLPVRAQRIITAKDRTNQGRRMVQAIAESGLLVVRGFGLPGQTSPIVIQVGHQLFHGVHRKRGRLQHRGIVLFSHALQGLADLAYQLGQQIVHNGMAIQHIAFITQAAQ